jgi:hypothetical protein
MSTSTSSLVPSLTHRLLSLNKCLMFSGKILREKSENKNDTKTVLPKKFDKKDNNKNYFRK